MPELFRLRDHRGTQKPYITSTATPALPRSDTLHGQSATSGCIHFWAREIVTKGRIHFRERLPPTGERLPPTGAFTFAPGDFRATQPLVLLHPVLLPPPPQPPELVHLSLLPLRRIASLRTPSGFCAGSAAPSMSTLPSESITTSEDRARAVRDATTDVAAPTASAAVFNNPRRLTRGSPSLLGSLDIAHPLSWPHIENNEDCSSVQATAFGLAAVARYRPDGANDIVPSFAHN
jgi:hypothetical protein